MGHRLIGEGLRTEGGAEAAVAFWWKLAGIDKALRVVYSIDERHADAVGARIKSTW